MTDQTPTGSSVLGRHAAARHSQVRDQARRYMEVVYGKEVWFCAPETFDNVLIRWIWAVASNEIEFADQQMTRIEEMARQQEEGITK